jgi:T5orf172 domain
MSHIYLIITLDNPARVKVGRTDRDPLERLQELQTGASSPLRLIPPTRCVMPVSPSGSCTTGSARVNLAMRGFG